MATALLATGCGSSTPTAPATPAASPAASASSAPTTVPSATPAPGTACTPAAVPVAEDWNERVWYETFVRSFSDGDGDGIGDFAGLTAKLDYLNDGDPATTDDLGVTGMWLMPIAESPSYHGYDVVDYEAVERDYGTREDLDAFLAAAHARGHQGDRRPRPEPHLDRPPVVQGLGRGGPATTTGTCGPTRTRRGWGPAARSPGTRSTAAGTTASSGRGCRTSTCAARRSPAALDDVARFWLEDVGVDGFRLDAAKHLIEDGKDAQTNTPETKAWLAGLKDRVDAIAPDAMTVGEVWDPATVAASVRARQHGPHVRLRLRDGDPARAPERARRAARYRARRHARGVAGQPATRRSSPTTTSRGS